MTEVKAFYKRSFYYLSGTAGSLLLGFLSFPLLTRTFSLSDYGTLDLIQKMVLLATAVGKLGLQNSALRFYEGSNLKQYYSTMLLGTLLTAGLSTTAACVALSLAPASVIPRNLHWLIVVSAGLAVIRALQSIVLAFLRVEQRSAAYNAVVLVSRAGTILLAFLLAAAHSLTVPAYIVITLVVEGGCIAAATLPLLKRGLVRLGDLDKGMLKTAISFGLPLIAYELVTIVLDSSDRVLIAYLVNTNALGYYSAAAGISAYVQDLLVAPLNLALVPMYMKLWAHEGPARTEAFLSQSFEIFLIIVLAVLPVALTASKDALLVLSSSKYESAGRLLPVLLLGRLLYAATSFLNAPLLIYRKTAQMAKIVLFAAIVNIGLNFLLIPAWGVQGAAAATSASLLLLMVLTWQASRRFLSIHVRASSLLKYSAVSLAACVPAALTDLHQPFLNTVVKSALAASCYGGLLYVTDARVRGFAKQAACRARSIVMGEKPDRAVCVEVG